MICRFDHAGIKIDKVGLVFIVSRLIFQGLKISNPFHLVLCPAYFLLVDADPDWTSGFIVAFM